MLTKKLGVKPNHQVLLLNGLDQEPPALTKLNRQLQQLPEVQPVLHTAGNISDREPSSRYDVVILFALSCEQVARFAPIAVSSMQKGGVLWTAYPKKSSGITSDINRDNGWEPYTALGYRAVSQVSIDSTWSALRFKPGDSVVQKCAPPPEIDVINRIVTIPNDLKEALESGGVLKAFEKLSFTHQKEYVIEIVTAKKEETRKRRIRRTLEALTRTGKS